MDEVRSGAGGGQVEEAQDHGGTREDNRFGEKQDVSNSQRVRYRKEDLLALRQQALADCPAVWSSILADLGPVAQELSEVDVEQVVIPPPRKRNVDRRQRGADKLTVEASPGVIWCGKKDVGNELVYEPLAYGSKLHDVAESEVESAGYVEVVDDDVYADSDSDDESFQPRAFAVQGEPDFESGPPQDGWEYLRRVRWEAARYPKVKVAKIDPKKFASAQTPYMPDIPEVQRCAKELLPSAEWETQFLADFSELRLRLAGVTVPPNVGPASLPPVRNKAAWRALCFGTIQVSAANEDESHLVDEEAQLVEDEAGSLGADEVQETTESIWGAVNFVESQDAGNEGENAEIKTEMGVEGMPHAVESAVDPGQLGMGPGVHGDDVEVFAARDDENKVYSCEADLCPEQSSERETGDETNDVSGPVSPISKEPRQLQLPELALLLRLDSVSRKALLRDQVSWLESVPGLPRDRAVWLFSLAAVVDKPLDAETSASVRALFRRCAEIRASKSNDDEELVMLNILLTISGRYFGQAEEPLPH